ncbi:MAG TPA: YkvA family protein [Actinomycetota bacterium]|jgi:uncharacterized membrane protein YkvA (DUF1232 family)|nr:YkvA family protein [Actinomycetota bacterium]
MVVEIVKKANLPDLLGRVARDAQNIARLARGLAKDPRVPKRNKLIFAGIAAYVVMPVDLIPDWLPGIGRLDDIIMVCVGIDSILNHTPKAILDEYWEGDQAVLDSIRSIVSTAVEFVPPQLMKTLYPSEQH